MNEKTKAPAIRFKGFSEEWEERKLGKVLTLLKDGTHGTHKDANDGPILLSAKNIKNGTVQWDESDRRISEDEYNSIHSNFKLQKGDVLLTIVGSIGETAILSQPKNVTFQRSVAFLRPSNEITSEFLYSEIQGQKFQKELDDRKSTSAQPGIYLGDLGEIPVVYPTSTAEQQKIGTYFRGLDRLIALQKRKLEKLAGVKKSMLQKMFPPACLPDRLAENGPAVPEIRFKGFTEPWEQRKFSDLAETRRGLTYKPTDVSTEGIRVLRSSNINEDTFVFADDDVFVTPDVVNIPTIKAGDILITSANGSNRLVGKHAIIKDLPNNSAVHGGFMLLASSKNPEFTNALMSASWYSNFISLYVAGGNGAIGNLNKSDLDTQDILVPSEAEQQKIGAYFSSLDRLIALHRRRLEKLQNLKKACLEKMFV